MNKTLRMFACCAICVSIAACSSPRDLPEPTGPLIPANTQIPADYHGNGLAPVPGGAQE